MRRERKVLVAGAIVVAGLMTAACGSSDESSAVELELTSSTMEEGSELPTDHTCDGSSATPPLEWSGAPDSTVGYAIAMQHVPGPGDTHWYWELWNIPADVTSIETNAEVPGDIGTNSVNGANEYAPPCSQGPGEKIFPRRA